MQIVSIYDDIAYSDKQPVLKVLINNDNIREVRIAFRQGQEMKEHKAGYPIVVHVIEGRIDFGVEGQRHILEKGTLITLDANVPHDLRALDDSIVRLSLNKADSAERVKRVVE